LVIFARDGFTALHFAAAEGHVGVISALLSAKAEVDSKNKSALYQLQNPIPKFKYDSLIFIRAGWTALQCATHNGHVEIIPVLLSAGAEVNSTNKSALY
jgi:ankyrin repeat protein